VKAIIEFRAADGTNVPFETEVSELDEAGLMSSRTGNMVATANQTLEEAMGAAKGAIVAIVTQLKDLAIDADEATVEFGLKVGLKYGVCITASGDASIAVKLTYKRKSS
jgi:hypothetical protein